MYVFSRTCAGDRGGVRLIPAQFWVGPPQTHKETSVPTVADTYHAAASAEYALFNNHLQMLPYIPFQEFKV